MLEDSISDFIVRLTNAGNAGKETVLIPYSKVLQKIAEVLEKNGYIRAHVKKGKKVSTNELAITLSQNTVAGPRIRGVKRRSKPSKRVYVRASDIHPIRHGYGMLVVSTSKGIMNGDDAKKTGLGGEVLFEIW